jgi:hypothetical protein
MEKLGQTTAKCSRARSRQNGSQREPCLRHGSTLRMKAQEDSSSRGQKYFICREEKRKAAWGHAGGPRNPWFCGSGWKLGFYRLFLCCLRAEMLLRSPGKEKCLLGQLSPFRTSCSPSFIATFWTGLTTKFFSRNIYVFFFFLSLLYYSSWSYCSRLLSWAIISGLSVYWCNCPKKFDHYRTYLPPLQVIVLLRMVINRLLVQRDKIIDDWQEKFQKTLTFYRQYFLINMTFCGQTLTPKVSPDWPELLFISIGFVKCLF